MPIYITNNELYHHGVKGMKWGVRKKRDVMLAAKKQRKAANKEYSKAFNKATSLVGAYGPNSKRNTQRMMETAKAANAANAKYKQAKKDYKTAKKTAKADARAKEKAARALSKMEKQQYKDAIKQRSKEILKGKSVIGKMWDITTGSHKIQAEVEYDMNKRAKVNKTWRD